MNGVVREKHGHSAIKQAQARLRLVLLVLITPLSIILCGQAAWMMRAPSADVEVRSGLSADYSPWTTAFFPGLDPSILLAALKDRNEGSLDTRRALSCFLLTSGCEIVTQSGSEAEDVTTMPESELRIANDVEPDLTHPDGRALRLQPGRAVALDIRSGPILVSGGDEPQADLLIYFLDDSTWDETEYLEVDIALRPEDAWIPVFNGGDQTHGDSQLGMPYGDGNPGLGDPVSPGLSDDALVNTNGFAIDVDRGGLPTGLYGWLRIGIDPAAPGPIGVDAIVVVDSVQ